MQRISQCLVTGGKIVIFEHNRLNPITRRIVDRCEFDEGVELLSKCSCEEMMESTGNFKDFDSGYFLVIPSFLKKVRNIERIFERVPLGAQFWLTAKRLG